MHATRCVLYLVPDMFGAPNGIARYCSNVHRALVGGGISSLVVALHDHPNQQTNMTEAPPPAEYSPCGGSRARFVAEAFKLALTRRPQVIFVGHPNFCGLGLALARTVSARLMAFVYGVDVWVPLPPPRRWALQRADRVIAISHFTSAKARLVNGVDPLKLRVLFNCLDPGLALAEENIEAPRSPRLLTVARIAKLENFKGHDVVMRALPALIQRHPSLIYDVVGDGGGRAELERLARHLGVSNAVRFLGTVSDRELSAIYGRASVMVMPSAREGFGFVFLEAMAHGTPAIGGNRDATPEVICDGETGFVVDPGSVSEVSAAIDRILADDSLRVRLGTAGRERAQTRFGFEGFRQQLLSHLGDLSS